MASVALVIVAVALGTEARSQEIVAGETYEVVGVVPPDTLRIRAEPGLTSKIVGEIPAETKWVIPTGERSQVGKSLWVHVGYQNQEGWVNSKFLRKYDGLPKTLLQLHEKGISVRPIDSEIEMEDGFSGKVPPHANKCPIPIGAEVKGGKVERGGIEVSVSTPMLSHFQARGFNLTSLCLAITTEMNYDTNTGTPLPGVYVAWHSRVLLNVPDCFKNGTPLLDCQFRYHWFWGAWDSANSEAKKNETSSEYRNRGKQLHEAMKPLIQKGQVADGQILDYTKFKGLLGETLADDVHGQNPPGGVSFIVSSTLLPHGYAYRLWTGHTAGDDPDETRVEEGTSGKRILSSSDMKAAVPWVK